MAKASAWERIEAARKKREAVPAKQIKPKRPKPAKGHWAVMKVNDSGIAIPWRTGLTEADADKLAGRQRDRMPDEEVGRGWTYLPRPLRSRLSPDTPRPESWLTSNPKR